MALRQANDDDWKAVFAMPVPAAWFGLALDRNAWVIEGLGAIYRGGDDRWWISFQRCLGLVKTKTAHAAAKQLLAMAADLEITVHGISQPGIEGGDRWMAKLGFVETDETLGGLTVWRTR